MSQFLTSIPASAVPRNELTRTLADYVALEEARVFRRLLVTRFGALTLIVAFLAVFVPALPTTARWLPILLFVAAPVWAWIAELRLERRVSRRLDGVDGTRRISSTFELDDC